MEPQNVTDTVRLTFNTEHREAALCDRGMMRIICPNCGDEPQKGQRHICRAQKAVEVVEEKRRRTAPCATASSMCASIASLATKNPGLWKSKRRLARTGGEDFVAALIFMAAGQADWNRDPKRTLMLVCNDVANEAAKALQQFWRQRCQRKEAVRCQKAVEAVAEYSRASPSGFVWRQKPAPAPAPQASTASAASPSRKSNPRPVQSRGVPSGSETCEENQRDGCQG